MARIDPYKNMRFKVTIGSITHGEFSECSGLSSTVEAVEHHEGGSQLAVKVPGKVTYPDIVLKWGLTDSRELYDWHKSVLDGVIERRNLTITLYDDTGKNELVQWNVMNAWPSKWEGSSFNAKGGEIAIETLTLSCERIERA